MVCTQGGSRPTRGAGNCSGTAATLGQSRWQREGTEGTELGGPTASGSPGQSHTLQGWHSTNTAPLLPQGCRQHLRSGGNHQSSRKFKPPCPHTALPDPRAQEPRAAEPWDSLGTVSMGPAQELPPVPARAPHCKPAQTHLHRGCASAGAGPQTSAPLPTHTAWLGLREAPSGCCHLPATVLHRDETQPAPLA